MQIDRKAIDKLLLLSDDKLQAVIQSLASTAGLDLSGFKISTNDIEGIRRALSSATDEDIKRAAEQLNAAKRKG